jgi:hypothetical protein
MTTTIWSGGRDWENTDATACTRSGHRRTVYAQMTTDVVKSVATAVVSVVAAVSHVDPVSGSEGAVDPVVTSG